jgi:virginiamycin A acetyltransferase
MKPNIPNKNAVFPLEGYERLCFLKNIIKNPNILVGDYYTLLFFVRYD